MGGIGSADAGVRVSVGAGALAFALSLLVAIFSRIPFGIMLLRATLLAVFFSLATFGLSALLRRFLPELFGEAPELSAEGDASGRFVNIVLPGEDEARAQPSDAEGSASDLDPRHDGSPSERQEGLMQASVVETLESPGEFATLNQEVEAIRSESLVHADGDAGQPVERGPRPSVALDELDVLPDLDSLSDSFATSVGGDEQSEQAANPYPSGADGASVGDKGDPALLAKAVQTLLRRDQKG